MPHRLILWTAVIAIAAGGCNLASAAVQRGPCDDSLTQKIPARADDARGGRQFAEQIRGLSEDQRESQIRRELQAGNIPQFLRQLVPIRLESPNASGKMDDIIVCAAPDYLAIGSDDDFLLIPMRLSTALSTASEYGFTLPTPRLVDAIYRQAGVHFVPQPLPASDEMRSTDYAVRHNELIGVQRAALDLPLGTLSAGDKKDLVLTNRLLSQIDRVAIYGWHTTDGKPIQPLSTVHGWRYADYSHGARLISTRAFINGKARSIFEIMQDNHMARALNAEGGIANVIGLIETLNARAAQATVAAIAPSLASRH